MVPAETLHHPQPSGTFWPLCKQTPFAPPPPSVKKLIEIPQKEAATESNTKAKNLIYIGVMEEAVPWFCRCTGVERIQKLKWYFLDTSSPCLSPFHSKVDCEHKNTVFYSILKFPANFFLPEVTQVKTEWKFLDLTEILTCFKRALQF